MSNDLNNQKMIEQAVRTQICEIEPLYWMLEDAIYNNQTDHAKSVYQIILYIAKYNPGVVQSLRDDYRNRLKEIAFELHGEGSLIVNRNPIVLKDPVQAYTLPFVKEKELQMYLHDHVEIFREALNDNITIRGTEVDTDFGYRCDLLLRSDTHCYPVELKIGQANHQVVSQINKYCWFFL